MKEKIKEKREKRRKKEKETCEERHTQHHMYTQHLMYTRTTTTQQHTPPQHTRQPTVIVFNVAWICTTVVMQKVNADTCQEPFLLKTVTSVTVTSVILMRIYCFRFNINL